ncbi:hypothetical protein RSOLAG1IB_08686 [Rhizoctonia solani AG-1 IB]|uniref:Uncharacterized protein n=1 Tax=Thanatephorus cucumeris (strain AG1-IB / isolate 7/3/14) TaxID=1108050 RepID=A0A0B7FLR5_THACB|nr:hypothetical protein RSOLAG1IB_08686 [Rhizoctonia solani AG-1 IB]
MAQLQPEWQQIGNAYTSIAHANAVLSEQVSNSFVASSGWAYRHHCSRKVPRIVNMPVVNNLPQIQAMLAEMEARLTAGTIGLRNEIAGLRNEVAGLGGRIDALTLAVQVK